MALDLDMTTGKRKHMSDLDDSPATKRTRNGSNTVAISSVSHEPLRKLFSDLSPKYNIKGLSVISSSSIAKKVDSALQHLSRFDLYNSAVLPGIVLLYARSNSTSKLITIAETVRRRIHEAGQKWYQYNRLYEMEWAAKQDQRRNQAPAREEQSMQTLIEDTIMSMDSQDTGGEGNDNDDDEFETMQPRTVFERAVHGEDKAKPLACMSIFLSRIPVPELRAMENMAVQSNEEHIELARKKKSGLVG